jgi:1-acyl-sn-glycerol-3-phosphate acyltransferase
VGPFGLLYGLYAWAVFLLLGIGGLLAPLMLMRSLPARRALVQSMARRLLRWIDMPLTLTGLERLPPLCVVVANHSSYIDGVLLAAALPPRFTFVIKREMASVPLAGLLLRRMGAQFVERHDRARTATDARRLLRSAAGGNALVFFPEGTFGTDSALGRFHIGAFAAAARAHLPLVPVVIHGARARLPPDSPWPRPGALEVEVLSVLTPAGPEPEAAVALRDQARALILTRMSPLPE